MKSTRLILAASVLLAANCFASTTPANPDKVDMTYAQFTAQKTEFMQNIDEGKTYKEITPENKARVSFLMDRMDARLKRAGSAANLSMAERTDFFNDQQEVNNLLTNASKDSRLVCRRTQEVGTHQYSNRCLTVAQMKREHEAAQETLGRGTGSPGAINGQ